MDLVINLIDARYGVVVLNVIVVILVLMVLLDLCYVVVIMCVI